MKRPTLTLVVIAIVALILLGSFIHVLSGLTKVLVVVVLVLALVITVRNEIGKRRARSR